MIFVKRDAKQNDKTKMYKKFYDEIKDSRQKTSVISRFAEEIQGDLNGEFSDFVRTYYKNHKIEDANDIFEEITVNKTFEEKDDIEKSGLFCTVLMRNMIDKIEQVIDEEAKCTHVSIIEDLTKITENAKFMDNFVNQCKDLNKCTIDKGYLEIGGPISIQSGGNFNLSSEVKSNGEYLSSDTIIITISTKYRDLFCTNSRSLIIDPDEAQKKAYIALWELQQNVMSNLKVGAKLSEVYKSAFDEFNKKHPELSK